MTISSISNFPHLYLASTSPRRSQLLQQIGLSFEVIPVTVPEEPAPGEEPVAYACRLALAKAMAGFNIIPDGLFLGADTDVVVDGEILGKPKDQQDALAMLERLSGRTHQVYSAVGLVSSATQAEVRLSVSQVTFRILGFQEKLAYVATGEGMDKAGGYAIQGRGAAFVANLVGSYSGVMGLPLCETVELLESFGYPVWSTSPGTRAPGQRIW